MASKTFEAERDVGLRTAHGLGMRLYWVVVTVLSLTLLGMTVHVATPRDAADRVEVMTTR